MKKAIFTLIVLTSMNLVSNTFAQDTTRNFKSVFNNDYKITGWYVGLNSTFTEYHHTKVNVPQLEGGIILNQSLSAGLKVSTFSMYESQLKVDSTANYEASYLTGGYIGLAFEPRIQPLKSLHLSFPCLLGIGGMSLISQREYQEWDDNKWEMSRHTLITRALYILEPGIAAELNVARFIRISCGLTYRKSFCYDMGPISENSLNGWSTTLSLKIGKFN